MSSTVPESIEVSAAKRFQPNSSSVARLLPVELARLLEVPAHRFQARERRADEGVGLLVAADLLQQVRAEGRGLVTGVGPYVEHVASAGRIRISRVRSPTARACSIVFSAACSAAPCRPAVQCIRSSRCDARISPM